MPLRPHALGPAAILLALLLPAAPAAAQDIAGIVVEDPYADVPRIVLPSAPGPSAAVEDQARERRATPAPQPSEVRPRSAERERALARLEDEYRRELRQAGREYEREMAGTRDPHDLARRYRQHVRELERMFEERLADTEARFDAVIGQGRD